jgi:pimeloyl-ACP methyl ester carboxylesterase
VRTTGSVTLDILPAVTHSAPVDGFRLAYDRAGSGPPVVLLHGWPGSRRDYREVVARLASAADVVVPDLRGFGDSDRLDAAAEAYAAAGQAASVLGLIDELGLDRPVLVGYDVGSRVAQTAARLRPDAVRALVVSPPDDEFDALVELYARPGAFAASIAWYRAGAGTLASALAERAPAPEDRLATPTTVLWPSDDPLFPVAWSDRIDTFLANAQLRVLDGVGHFVALQAPDEVAAAIRAATGTSA